MSESPNENLVELRGVNFTRDTKHVLRDIDLTVKRGSITAIMGPSGCGKTTLLRLIGGQLKPQTGTVMVDGEPVHQLGRRDLTKLRKRMGMLFQSGALLTDLSVFDNVAYPLREHAKLPETMIRDLVLMKLNAVGLRGAQRLMPSQLSGGMARRVALVRAIALEPMMVMYDEPFTGQDPISMGVLLRLIKSLNEVLGLTSIVVSHDVHESLGIADYVYILSGDVAGKGSPEELLESESEWVSQFLHGKPDGPVPFHQSAPGLDVDFGMDGSR